MTCDERSTLAPCGRGDLAARYEELRGHALRGAGRGAGLIVFLRQGMRAWMEAGGAALAAWASITGSTDSRTLGPQGRAELVLVLAAMALGCRRESPPKL